MGTWGPAIFADDDAEDLRDEYRYILADAQSDSAATDAAMAEYGAAFDRLDATTPFWLALALIQWKLGRLDSRVRAAALRIIDEGIDLAKWNDSPIRKKRAGALAKARATIESPPPAAQPMPKPLPLQLPGWEFSEVVGYRMPNGRLVLLHHLNYRAWSTARAKAPVVSILSWFGTGVPDEAELAALTYINHGGSILAGHHLHCLAMPTAKSLENEQFVKLGRKKPVTRDEATSAVYGLGGHEGLTLEIALNKVLHAYWRDPTIPPHLPKQLPDDRAEAQAVIRYWTDRLSGTGWSRSHA
jgi:hypothetical protein